VLSLFGQSREMAMERYREFVESVQREKLENPFKDIVSGIILGGTEFINWIKSNFLPKDSDYKEKPQLRSLKPLRGMNNNVVA
jgi:hypothetical protein